MSKIVRSNSQNSEKALKIWTNILENDQSFQDSFKPDEQFIKSLNLDNLPNSPNLFRFRQVIALVYGIEDPGRQKNFEFQTLKSNQYKSNRIKSSYDVLEHHCAQSVKSLMAPARINKENVKNAWVTHSRSSFRKGLEPLKTSAMDILTPTTIGVTPRSLVPCSARLKNSSALQGDVDNISQQLRSYIRSGFELTDKLKEQHKIYAPKAFNFLCKESRRSSRAHKRKAYCTTNSDL